MSEMMVFIIGKLTCQADCAHPESHPIDQLLSDHRPVLADIQL